LPNNSPNRKPYQVTWVILYVIAVVIAISIGHVLLDWQAMARARKLVNPFPATSAALAAGAETYRAHCQSCHGPNGDGKGDKASELSVSPGDFTDAAKMRGFADGELFWQITKGRRPMPSFQHKLTDQERWQAVDYIRTFASKPVSPTPAPGQGTQSPRP
jgi:mono/diheme cytochrome c family protein